MDNPAVEVELPRNVDNVELSIKALESMAEAFEAGSQVEMTPSVAVVNITAISLASIYAIKGAKSEQFTPEQIESGRALIEMLSVQLVMLLSASKEADHVLKRKVRIPVSTHVGPKFAEGMRAFADYLKQSKDNQDND